MSCFGLQALSNAMDSIDDARVPAVWLRGSWDSSTLGFWFTELLERNQQFSTWLAKGRPAHFWMTGFFNPQGKQNIQQTKNPKNQLVNKETVFFHLKLVEVTPSVLSFY